MAVDLLAQAPSEPTQKEPVDLLAGLSPEEDRGVLSFRKPEPRGLWETIKEAFPDDAASEKAKAQNAVVYSEMLGIRPAEAYEFHDEISEQFRNKTAGEKIATTKRGVSGALEAGFENSIAGLMYNQKVPQPFESVSQAERWIEGMVAMGLDLPVFVAGYAIGGGQPISGMAGAFGFHSGLRQVLIDRYSKGEVKDAADLFDRMGNAVRETVKGEIVGSFTGGAKFMAPTAFKALAPGLEAPAAWTLWAEIATMTAAGKLIEGQLPTAQDFIDTTAILLTMHVGTRGYESAKARMPEIKSKLQDVFVQTGAHPKEILSEIARERIDPREDIIETIERVGASLKEAAPEAKIETGKKEIVEPGATSQAGERVPRPEPQETGQTGTKNAITAAEREATGREPVESPIGGKRAEGWREEVEAKVDAGEIDVRNEARKIVNTVENGERPQISQDLEHALGYDRKRLQNERKSVETALEKEPTPELRDRLEKIESALDDNYLATQATSTEWGRIGVEKQQIINEDYSLAALVFRAKREGVKITPEIREKYSKLSKKIEKLQKEIDEGQQMAIMDNVAKTVKQIQNEEAKAQRQQKREVKAEALDAEFDALVKDFNKTIGGQLNVGVDPAGVKILVELARNRIQKGIVKAEDIVDSIYTALKNAGIEYSKREIRDAISQYGVTKEMSKEEISVALREAKRQMRLISAIEDAKKGIKPAGSGVKRDPMSDQVREMTRELRAIMRENNIGTQEAFIKRKTAEIAEYERRLKEGDFSEKPKRKALELSDKELELQYKLDQLKREYVREAVNDRLKQRKTLTIAYDSVIESIHLIKAIKSSFDVSAPGRQGLFALISHPIKGFKNIPDMFRALGSERAAFRIEQEIQGRKNYKLYREGGVALTESRGASSNVEEMYRSRWGELVPGIPASNRAFTSYLNLIRADLFDAMHKSAFSTRTATPAELKAIGDYVNMATGRGSIKGYENMMIGLGTIMWAPKLVLSRFQMLLGKGLMPGGGRTAATRIAVAKEYARILTGLATIYAMHSFLTGEPVEDDPRSSDFGKIVVGNTRIDVLAGVSQATVFTARIISGETKSLKSGQVKPIRGDYVPYGGTDTWKVITNFLRTKLTPAIGIGINLVDGKDLMGEKITLYDVPRETLVPLAMMDIYDAMDEEGVPPGFALGILGMFGVGIQTHEEKGARR